MLVSDNSTLNLPLVSELLKEYNTSISIDNLEFLVSIEIKNNNIIEKAGINEDINHFSLLICNKYNIPFILIKESLENLLSDLKLNENMQTMGIGIKGRSQSSLNQSVSTANISRKLTANINFSTELNSDNLENVIFNSEIPKCTNLSKNSSINENLQDNLEKARTLKKKPIVKKNNTFDNINLLPNNQIPKRNSHFRLERNPKSKDFEPKKTDLSKGDISSRNKTFLTKNSLGNQEKSVYSPFKSEYRESKLEKEKFNVFEVQELKNFNLLGNNTEQKVQVKSNIINQRGTNEVINKKSKNSILVDKDNCQTKQNTLSQVKFVKKSSFHEKSNLNKRFSMRDHN